MRGMAQLFDIPYPAHLQRPHQVQALCNANGRFGAGTTGNIHAGSRGRQRIYATIYHAEYKRKIQFVERHDFSRGVRQLLPKQ